MPTTVPVPSATALVVRTQTAAHAARRRLIADERGEGVISAAIVVLIMAFLGVVMWGAFRLLFQSAADKTSTQVEQIGS